ncbi:MAG: 3-hydroxyisobutyryl-CoA hydrolase [Devosia sp.]
MTDQLDITADGHLGYIALDRPKAINALSLEMIEGISAVLGRWRDDRAIGAVLFTGRGERGFCAGGDVRAARTNVIDGRPEAADAYFAAEYAMNRTIAAYPKPLVALTHGIVMGGGIGIAGHCRYRLATTDCRYAMPEAAIGFFSDVGVNAILAHAPVGRALLFLMSGTTVGTADALALGLADAAIAPARVEPICATLVAAAGARDPNAAIVALMESESIFAGDAGLTALADQFPASVPESPHALLESVAAIPALAASSSLLATRSPTSLTAIFHAHLAARRLMDVGRTLDMDLRLAALMARQPDFAEGVRAVLVDKDQAPKWSPARLSEVDAGAILEAVKAA